MDWNKIDKQKLQPISKKSNLTEVKALFSAPRDNFNANACTGDSPVHGETVNGGRCG